MNIFDPMKRTALLLITAIYLLSLVGIGINRFYCCGKITSVKLSYAALGHTDKDNCCKQDSKNFKVKDNHINVASFALGQPSPATLLVVLNWTGLNAPIKQVDHTAYLANAPPGNADIPAYTLNCTYRI